MIMKWLQRKLARAMDDSNARIARERDLIANSMTIEEACASVDKDLAKGIRRWAPISTKKKRVSNGVHEKRE